MPWKVKTFVLANQELHEVMIYEDQEEAMAEALHIMFMQPGEVIAIATVCDQNGNYCDTEKACS